MVRKKCRRRGGLRLPDEYYRNLISKRARNVNKRGGKMSTAEWDWNVHNKQRKKIIKRSMRRGMRRGGMFLGFYDLPKEEQKRRERFWKEHGGLLGGSRIPLKGAHM